MVFFVRRFCYFSFGVLGNFNSLLTQDQELNVFVEKVDWQNRLVYVSQTHWLWMKNLIKSELDLDVKIIKRYAGKLTVGKLINQGQIVDKIAVKRLSEIIGENIYLKTK